MANFASENTWYKGTLGLEFITAIDIRNTYNVSGEENEFWDASAQYDGSAICYRIGNELIIVCEKLTIVHYKMFNKFLSLQRISGLDEVTQIGDFAFCYTPKLTELDIVPGNITNVGASAFRMSGIEDYLDLSVIPSDVIGNMATRHKRWDANTIASFKNVVFPEYILLDIENTDCQYKYPDIKFGTAEDGTVYYADHNACSAFACYHIWNCLHNETKKQYGDWPTWFNENVNADGSFVASDPFIGGVAKNVIAKLGWKDKGRIFVNDSAALQSIVDSLALGLPLYTVIHSPNRLTGYHAVAIVGCDAITRKLAVIDSGGIGDNAILSWVSYEDIFTGTDNADHIRVIGYEYPILAPNNTWFSRNSTNIDKKTITSIEIKDNYTPTNTSVISWDASAIEDGSVIVYVEDDKLTISGNGSGAVHMSPDSSSVFNGFTGVTSFVGASLLNTIKVTTLKQAFYDCSSLLQLDLTGWNVSNVRDLHSTFNGMYALTSLRVRGWNTSNVTNMALMFCKTWAFN